MGMKLYVHVCNTQLLQPFVIITMTVLSYLPFCCAEIIVAALLHFCEYDIVCEGMAVNFYFVIVL